MQSQIPWAGIVIAVLAVAGGCCPCQQAGGNAAPAHDEGSPTVALGILGASASRNNVNLVDKKPPTEWSVDEKTPKNIKWSAAIGDRGYGCPIVAGGKVFVSTNNVNPRDPKIKGDKAIILCFNEADGKFLWQSVHEMAPPQIDQMAHEDGMCSTPTVEDEALYFVTPGCKVTCATTKDGTTLWQYDLMKELKVSPCMINSCSPLIVGDLLYVNTGNGVNDMEFPSPQAPSFVALNKKTGKLVWQNNAPGKGVLHGQWGSLAYAEVNGKGQVVCPSGDGYLYGLDALTGDMIWKFQCNPFKAGSREAKNKVKRNYLVATPVVHGTRAYIGVGAAPDTGYGNSVGHFWCIDITKKGDVSCPAYDFDPKSPQNKDSALVWHFGGETKGERKSEFGQTYSSAVVHEGLVYLPEVEGYFHCLDAGTGARIWEHDFKSGIWGSPLFAGGYIYQGCESGDLGVFAPGRAKKLIAQIDMGESLQSTPVVANDTLFVVTKTRVYAIAAK